MTTTPTPAAAADLPGALRLAAEAVKVWSNIDDFWPLPDSDCGEMVLGAIEEGTKYELLTIDADACGADEESEKLARFYAAANPGAVLALLDERDWLAAQVAALTASAPAKWIDDPHDIEQGRMLNPEWLRMHGLTALQASLLVDPGTAPTAPQAGAPVELTDEQLAEKLAESDCEPGASWRYAGDSEKAIWIKAAQRARALLRGSTPQAGAESYPPLPDGLPAYDRHGNQLKVHWDADQMRGYADAAIALRAGHAAPPAQQPGAEVTEAQIIELLGDPRFSSISAVREALKRWGSPAAPSAQGDAPLPWLPYLVDRADACKGHFAIARDNAEGYREVWNLRRHKWSSFSDDVLTLEQAKELLRNLVIPTAPQADAPVPSAPAFQSESARRWALAEAWGTAPKSAASSPTQEAAQPAAGQGDAARSIELTDDVRFILGFICFQCMHIVQALRLGGREINTKAEDEQAAAIHFMLNHYLADRENWRENVNAELRAMAAKGQQGGAA